MAGEQYEQIIGDLVVWKSDEGYEFLIDRGDGEIITTVLDLVDLQGLRDWINDRLGRI